LSRSAVRGGLQDSLYKLPPVADQRTCLEIEPRDGRGSRATRRLRREGYVPGVVYGKQEEAAPFQVDARRLRAVLAEGHALFDVQLDGGRAEPVIVKEQQRDPLRGTVLHLDLLRVRLDEKIQSMVPLELEGGEEAPGVKEGGVLGHVTREVLIEALPTDIPDRLVADVSALGIGGTLLLSMLSPPSGVTLSVENAEDVVVATVTAPSEVVEEPEVEEEAELVGEEAAEPAEGETPAEEAPAAKGGEAPAEGGGQEG
jgi:large subunit ribosomal protein L25